jgi:hypothetical protein
MKKFGSLLCCPCAFCAGLSPPFSNFKIYTPGTWADYRGEFQNKKYIPPGGLRFKKVTGGVLSIKTQDQMCKLVSISGYLLACHVRGGTGVVGVHAPRHHALAHALVRTPLLLPSELTIWSDCGVVEWRFGQPIRTNRNNVSLVL